MTDDQRRKMLIGVLVCSLLFTGYTLWPDGGPAGRTATTGGAAAAPPAAQPAPGDAPAPEGAPAVVSEAPPITQADLAALRRRVGGDRRDPFFTVAELEAMNRPEGAVAIATGPDALPAYTVTLVMMTGSQGQALIGRQVVKVGDMLGNERVAQIAPDVVVLEHEGRRRRLEVATNASTATRIETERTR